MPTTKLTIKAYAKINLGLRVLGMRPDGYHELSTLLQSLDLADTLTLERQDDGLITLEIEPNLGIPTKENLVYRAAELILSYAEGKAGAHLKLLKHIPAEAGLGVGSSDATATLVGLNELFQLSLTNTQLHELAQALGSDVPFFLEGGFCEAYSRGQFIKKLPPLLWDRWFVLLVPPFQLPTHNVYREFDRLNVDKPQDLKEEALSFMVSDDPHFIHLANDLEDAAASLCPELRNYRQFLTDAGAEFFSMSGSGPTYYAAFKHKEQAELFAVQAEESLVCEVFLTKPTTVGYEILEEY